jgi:phosphoglycerate dehydrogenase-like enzyme
VQTAASRQESFEHLGDADVLLTFTPMMSDAMLQASPRLKWIQALGTGVDNLIELPSLRSDVIVTNMRGIHGAPVAEAALASMLALSRGLPDFVRNQDRAQWQRWPARLLNAKTVGILGIGVIAETLAPICKAFGMEVLGFSSEPRAVPGFDAIHRRSDLQAMAHRLDYLVLLAPLTEATRNIIDARMLAAMKPSAFLINFARGGVVDETALVETLKAKAISGAALDVFNEEPLPADNPLWGLKNVLITTHQGGFCDVYPKLALPIISQNLRLFMDGRTDQMVNRVHR